MERIPFTRAGLARVKSELEQLENVERPSNIRAIEEARAHGDISENAEYHAAKERQAFLDGKINELKRVIGRAEIIEIEEGPADSVVFGKTVLLYDLHTDEEVSYHRREREGGAFNRKIPLPARVSIAKVSAETKNGILRVVLPKADEVKQAINVGRIRDFIFT